jgi:predicted AlkP superfamily pyrophosphatase or phosphodiesterase
MNIARRTLIVALAMAAVSTGSTVAAEPVRKAMFIIVDGIPADVVERESTPVFDDIAGAGGYTRSWVGGEPGGPSESPTVSAVGYMSLITGTWSNKHNVYSNSVDDPDYRYWDIFRIAKTHDPSISTAVYSTWTDNRTKLLGDGLAAAGGHKLDYYFDELELDLDSYPVEEHADHIREIDDRVVADAARHVSEHGPDLSWIYLQHTDDIAHRYGDSPELNAALAEMEKRVGIVWDAIKKREAEHDEEWLLIVTTDHGRDATSGRHHGGQSARERTTWIVTNSRQLNDRFEDDPPIVDILPSIATFMDLSIPAEIAAQLDGVSFID